MRTNKLGWPGRTSAWPWKVLPERQLLPPQTGTAGHDAPAAASPGRRKVVLVAMLIDLQAPLPPYLSLHQSEEFTSSLRSLTSQHLCSDAAPWKLPSPLPNGIMPPKGQVTSVNHHHHPHSRTSIAHSSVLCFSAFLLIITPSVIYPLITLLNYKLAESLVTTQCWSPNDAVNC